MAKKRTHLWQAMARAWSSRVIVGLPDAERLAIAAEIRALRDWLVPAEPQPLQSHMPFSVWNLKIEVWDERQRLRALLTAEANKAENCA